MSIYTLAFKVIGKVPVLRSWARKHIVKSLQNPRKLRKLNRRYLKMSTEDHRRFHALFAKIFRDHQAIELDDYWTVYFSGKEIKLPLQGNDLWLHWDTAVSIVGNDLEVKNFYEKLLNSDHRPNIFFDVGANYGTHSLLFHSQGVQTISFEPNPNAYKGYRNIEELNGVKYNTEKVAVGSKTDKAELVFPKYETWLGSISSEYTEKLEGMENVEKVEVDVITLEDYIARSGLKPDLIKIDTEGFEYQVLMGAEAYLKSTPCLVVFECTTEDEKANLWEFFNQIDYSMHDIHRPQDELTNKDQFMRSSSNNYLAASPNHNYRQDLY